MGYFLILLFTLCNLGESLFVKEYAKRHGSGGMLMNAVIALFASLFFLITDTGGFYVPAGMLPLALINCCLFAAGFYFTFVAFRIGPYGLTRLISNFSLLFTIFYGLIFLEEPITPLTFPGIAMILAAMVLINYKGKGSTAVPEENGVSLRWLIYILISVFANGFISILVKMQKLRFDGACDNEFQFLSIGIACVLMAVIGVIMDKDKLGGVLRHGFLYGAGSGLFNGAKNFITPLIYGYLSISVVSPVKTGLGMVATFLLAALLYKEKYTKLQLVGVVLGAVAVVLLGLPSTLFS